MPVRTSVHLLLRRRHALPCGPHSQIFHNGQEHVTHMVQATPPPPAQPTCMPSPPHAPREAAASPPLQQGTGGAGGVGGSSGSGSGGVGVEWGGAHGGGGVVAWRSEAVVVAAPRPVGGARPLEVEVFSSKDPK